MRVVLAAVRRHGRWLAVTCVVALLVNGLRILIPLLVRDAIDKGLEPYDGHELLVGAIAILVVSLLSSVLFSVQWYTVFQLGLRTEADLRQRLFDQYQRLHFAFHDEARTGELMARATTDLQQIQMLAIWIPVSVSIFLTVGVVAVILVVMSPRLALVALAPLAVYLVAAVRYSQQVEPLAENLQQRLAEVSGAAEESISGVRGVKGFGAEAAHRERMRHRAEAVWDRGMDLARLRSNLMPVLQQAPMLGIVAVLYLGGRDVLDGRLTLGQLVAFNAFILVLVTPLQWSAQIIATVARSAVSAARIYDVLRIDPEIADRPGAVDLPDGPGEVRFAGVTFAYAATSPILRGIDLTLRGGETVALVGRTGSGKSTVARLIPRFYDASSGAITIDGVDIRDVKLASLRRAVGIVFEDTFLFTDTIGANIAFGDPRASAADIERAARLAGAHEFITELPDGYGTVLGESGFSLSGGQRQRIAIARAILADPRVLILDDATSAVDASKEHEIRAALEEVTHGRTTLIIGHRPATIALADRVVVIDGGVVAAEGTHTELLATSPLYNEILALAERDEPGELVEAT
jgi:ATP-binding cassette subfamily B protein